MRKVWLNQGIETNTNVFPQDILESDVGFFRQKILKYFIKTR